MNKMGKKEYLILIADTLCDAYGDTLWEGGTDIDMAKRVLKKLTPYLFFHPQDISKQDWNKWKNNREHSYSGDCDHSPTCKGWED
jgi:hypothetical protein